MSTSTKKVVASKVKKVKDAETPVVTPAPQPTPAETPVVTPAPQPTPAETPVVTPAPPQPAPSKSKKSSTVKKQRTRRNVTRESLDLDFTALQTKIEEEIAKLRQSSEKVKGVKFLRSINKAVKILRSDSVRVMKIKPKSNRPRSTNSGFMKPVGISQEMAQFTGWDASQLYSRVDVTKFICKYIRENKLQNASDRRQILCDEKLKALLRYDEAAAKDAPLTYFRLQQYIQRHFIKESSE